MKFKPKNRSVKIEMRCFQCRESCATKDGDWHTSPIPGQLQVFLCRTCEREAKLTKSSAPLY
jgi:hypothetical protein